MMHISNKTRKWIRGGVEILLHGGASAMASTITAWAIDHKDWGFLSPNFWRMAGGTFMLSGGLRFFQWFSNNPLPPEDETAATDRTGTPIIPQPQISMNPLSKVTPLTTTDPPNKTP